MRSNSADCLPVIRQNAPRIWDIGDLEYRVVADFVNELPMDQLTEVEANSPVRLLSVLRYVGPSG